MEAHEPKSEPYDSDSSSSSYGCIPREGHMPSRNGDEDENKIGLRDTRLDEESSYHAKNASSVKPEHGISIGAAFGKMEGPEIILVEEDQIGPLPRELAKLKENWQTAVYDLSHREEREEYLEERKEQVTEGFSEQSKLLCEAREAKRKAERKRKLAEVERNELLLVKHKIDEVLKNYLSRGTICEEQARADELELIIMRAETDLSSAEARLAILQRFPNQAQDLRPMLEVLSGTHRQEPSPPKERAESNCDPTVTGQATCSTTADADRQPSYTSYNDDDDDDDDVVMERAQGCRERPIVCHSTTPTAIRNRCEKRDRESAELSSLHDKCVQVVEKASERHRACGGKRRLNSGGAWWVNCGIGSCGMP